MSDGERPPAAEQPRSPKDSPRAPFPDVLKWVRIGLAGLAFLGFWIGAAVLALVVLPLCVPLLRRRSRFERAAVCQRCVQRTFIFLHDYMRWCGLLHFNPRVVDRTVPAPGFVLVANHPTLVDVVAISAVYGRMVCVAKTPLFRSPIVGQVLRACEYVDGGDGDPFSGALVVSQAIERVSDGMPVLIFPEGTRSPEGGLHPFKLGAFEIACRANVPILPLLVRCTPPALGKGRPWYDIPRKTAQFTVTPLPAMLPVDFANDAAAMTQACEIAYHRELGLETPERQTDELMRQLGRDG
jgi:1-acyl-sn-glycerol-3-phosphate acyltransferase